MRQLPAKNKERFLVDSRRRFVANLSVNHENISILLARFACVAAAAFADGVVAPGAKLEKLAGDFAFTEGPTCDKNGNVFFVDQPNNRIMEWSADGKLSTFMQPSGYANGMMFDAQRQSHRLRRRAQPALVHRAGQDRDRARHELSRANTSTARTTCGSRPTARCIITDPFYRRKWWDHTTMALTNEEVFYLSPDRKTLTRVTDDLKKPNGITGTPDGKNLFVADIGARTRRGATTSSRTAR